MSCCIFKFQCKSAKNNNIGRGCLLLICMILLTSCGGEVSSTSTPANTPYDNTPYDNTPSDNNPAPDNPPPVNNNATLTWQSPTKNADGSPISDLAGHTIYMSSTSGVYDMNDIVTNVTTNTTTGGTTETYTVSDLPPGTHYFQITAFNAAGFESAPSIEVQKTIQ